MTLEKTDTNYQNKVYIPTYANKTEVGADKAKTVVRGRGAKTAPVTVVPTEPTTPTDDDKDKAPQA